MSADPIPPDSKLYVAPEAAPEAQGESPGHLIRQARERAQLSIEELGAQTKLARVTLEALERDDFKQLTEPVYVQGYYRKCAKVLGLQESALVAAYRHVARPQLPTSPSKLLLAGESSELVRKEDNRSVGGWWILLVVVAIAAAVVWYLQRYAARHAAPASTTSTTAPPAEHTAASGGSVPAARPAVMIGETQPPANAASAGISGPSAAPAMPGAQPASAATAPSAPAVSAVSASPQVRVAAAKGDLVLVFNNDCWVRIEDSTGKRLLTGLIRGGETKTLSGVPPYSVFLGDARAVVVRYGGRTIDSQPYLQPNSTAQFTVPQR